MDVLSCDNVLNKVYMHVGFTSTIYSSFTHPTSLPSGLAWDGLNVITCEESGNRIRQFDCFSSVVQMVIDAPSQSPAGLCWKGGNLCSNSRYIDRIFEHDGFSATISNSFDFGTDVSGLSWDGSNLMSCDYATDVIYQHIGFSSSINITFSSPSTLPRGLGWDGSNLLSCDGSSQTIYKHDGFSSSVTDSFPSPGNEPSGLDWRSTVVKTYLYYGSAPSSAPLRNGNLYLNTQDNNNKNRILRPTSGSNYSFWKHIAPYVESMGGWSSVSNFKFFVANTINWTGCTLRCAQVTNYDQATGTVGETGDEASTHHTDSPTMVDVNNYTSSSPLSLTGGALSPGKAINGYLLLQLEVTSSAALGDLDPGILCWRYDLN